MKKEMSNRILLIVLCSLMLISFVAMVSAASLYDQTVNSQSSFLGNIKVPNLFGGIQGSTLSADGLRILFGILIALLIYSAISTIGFIDSKIISWVIGIVIAIISVSFISDASFIGIGNDYAAFGMALTVFLPFIIIAFFSFSAAKKADANARILQYIAWMLFDAFLWIRAVFADIPGESRWYIIIPAIAALGMILFNRMIYRGLMKMYTTAYTEGSKTELKKAIEMERMQAEGLEELSETGKKLDK